MKSKINSGVRGQFVDRATLGQQRSRTLLVLVAQRYGWCLFAVGIAFVVSQCLFWYFFSGSNIFEDVKLFVNASLQQSSVLKNWVVIHDDIRVWFPNYVTGFANDQPKMTAEQVTQKLYADSFAPYLLWCSIMGSTFLSCIAYQRVDKYFVEQGSSADEHVRGGKLLTEGEYLHEVKQKGGVSNFTFGGVPYPKGNEFLGTLIIGGAGSGKSNEYRPAMENAFLMGKKCIIYDPTGEDVERYFRPGIDILLAPANQLIALKTGEIIKPIGWSILRELSYKTDAQLIGNAFIPVSDDQKGDFFANAAQLVFGAVLKALYEQGETSTSAIYDLFANVDKRPELLRLLKSSLAVSVLGKSDGEQADGVLASISKYLGGLDLIRDGDFSIRQFVRDEESDARLFIVSKDAREVLIPFYRVALTLAWNELSLMPPANGASKCCFFLDEMPSLGFMERLPVALQEMRKYGVFVMAVCQSLSQLRNIYGEEGGRNLYGAFQNIAVYRVSVKSEQEEISGLMGEQEIIEKSTTMTLAVQADRDGVSEQSSIVSKALIHFSEFHLLGIGQAYVRFAGFNPFLLDNALIGNAKSLKGDILVGSVSKAKKKFVIKDSSGHQAASGIADEKCNFFVKVSGQYTSVNEFTVIVPPIFQGLNDGLSLTMNPELELKVRGFIDDVTTSFPVTQPLEMQANKPKNIRRFN